MDNTILQSKQSTYVPIQIKKQVIVFHLKIKKQTDIVRNNPDLENTAHPKYIYVLHSLDMALRYKLHIQNTKMTLDTRNDLIKKLRNSK